MGEGHMQNKDLPYGCKPLMRKFIKITVVFGSYVIFQCSISFYHFGDILKVGGLLEEHGCKLKFIEVSFAYSLHSALHG